MTKQNEAQISLVFRQLLAKYRTNAYRLAKETGIDRTYLSKLANGAIAKPGEDKLDTIARGLGIEASQLARVFSDPQAAVREFDLIGIEPTRFRSTIEPRQDWGEAPDGTVCCERQTEIEEIKHWIEIERSRIVTLYGLDGIGKTTLGFEIARQSTEFEYIIWRDLGNIPLIEFVIQDTLRLFSRQTGNDLAIAQQITRLIDRLRTHRCLIILDRAETILATSSLQTYQNDHQAYGELFRQIAQSNHQSCLLLIANEKPKDLAIWEGSSTEVRSWQLRGSTAVCQQILTDKQIPESNSRNDLIEAYRGHPLAIKIVATIINELFEGNVAEFLQQNTLFLGDLEFVLYQQYQRLTDNERTIIHAIARITKPLSLSEIAGEFSGELRRSQLIACLDRLKRRSLIETVESEQNNCYTIHPIVRKYINSQI